MTLDVTVDVRETSQTPPTPEKRKWGFHVQRDTDSVNTLARFLSTTVDAPYQNLKELTKLICQTDPVLQGKSNILSFLQDSKLHGEFSDTTNMDKETYLTNLTEVFDFSARDKKGKPKKVRLSNFSDIYLTEDQLFEVADAIGEVHIQNGGEIMDYLSSIMIVPDGHPSLWEDGNIIARGRAFKDIVIVNAKYLKSFITDPALVNGKRPNNSGGGLKGILIHEIGHLWANNHEKEAIDFGKATKYKIPPTEYAEKIDSQTGHKREVLPETLAVDAHPEYASLVYGGLAKGLQNFRKDTYPTTPIERDGEVKDEPIAGPTIITCRQVNPEALVRLNSVRSGGDKRWMPRWIPTQEGFTQDTLHDFTEAALVRLDQLDENRADQSQNSDTKSTKIGHIRLDNGDILRITHLIVDKPDDYEDDRIVYPREDTIVEIINNRPDARGVCVSHGLRVTRRKEDYAKTHVQRIIGQYERPKDEDYLAFKTLPGVNQYKIDYYEGAVNNKEIKEMMQQIATAG